MLDKEWFSTQEIAALGLPGMPNTKRGVQAMADAGRWNRPDYQDKYWRMRAGRGGGIEYQYTVLPDAAQAQITIAFLAADAADARQAAHAALSREELSRRFDMLPDKHKDKARERLKALQTIEQLVLTGVSKGEAQAVIGQRIGVGLSSIRNWEAAICHVPVSDRLFYLAPHYAGRTVGVECHPDAWEFLKTDWLRPEKRTFDACYRDLVEVAAANGWTIPSARTLQRRLDALPEGLRVLAREGADALKRIYPAQERDRGVFHALEGVNADGHKWDVFVKWPDGYVGRPMMVAFQDLYSGLMLSYRIDRSENKHAVRLGDDRLQQQAVVADRS